MQQSQTKTREDPHRKRLKTKHKTAVKLAKKLEALDYRDQAYRMSHCAVYKQAWACTACTDVHYRQTRCKHRLCPICGPIRAHEQYEQLRALAKQTTHLKFITLTQPPVRQLKTAIKELREAFKGFRNAKHVKARIKGGSYKIEAKPRDDGTWHLHLHVLADCSYYPKKALIRDWGQFIGHSAPSVDIQDVRDRAQLRDQTKYQAKAEQVQNWSESQLEEYLYATKNVRLLQTWGTMFDKDGTIKDDLEKPNEPISCPTCGREHCVFPLTILPMLEPEWWAAVKGKFRDTEVFRIMEGFEDCELDEQPEIDLTEEF